MIYLIVLLILSISILEYFIFFKEKVYTFITTGEFKVNDILKHDTNNCTSIVRSVTKVGDSYQLKVAKYNDNRFK